MPDIVSGLGIQRLLRESVFPGRLILVAISLLYQEVNGRVFTMVFGRRVQVAPNSVSKCLREVIAFEIGLKGKYVT